MKQKTKLWIFYISTLGIGYFLAKKKVKSLIENSNDTIVTSKDNKFNVGELINALGGSDNIVNVEATISNLKVDVNNKDIINQDRIKSLGIKGSFINENKITILLGDCSQDIASKLKGKISK